MISVCIATHNGEKYIKEQLDSILCQLAPDDEVVISDDGSTDRTLDIISDYNDQRLKVYHFKQPTCSSHTHLYVTRNFENAIKHAKGEYFFLSDQDDRWMPNKVERCIAALQKCGLVVHNMRIADGEMRDSGENYYKCGFKCFRNYLICKGYYFGCTIAFRAELLKYILPFPPKLMIHDFWVGILAECFGNATYIDEPLIMYRFYSQSASHSVKNPLWFKLAYRAYTLWHLYGRIIKGKLKL